MHLARCCAHMSLDRSLKQSSWRRFQRYSCKVSKSFSCTCTARHASSATLSRASTPAIKHLNIKCWNRHAIRVDGCCCRCHCTSPSVKSVTSKTTSHAINPNCKRQRQNAKAKTKTKAKQQQKQRTKHSIHEIRVQSSAAIRIMRRALTISAAVAFAMLAFHCSTMKGRNTCNRVITRPR